MTTALAILGFVTVVAMIVLIMTKKLSPTVALIIIPIITGIIACFFMVTDPEKAPGVVDFAANLKKLGGFITGSKGIGSVAATGVMFIFSILSAHSRRFLRLTLPFVWAHRFRDFTGF